MEDFMQEFETLKRLVEEVADDVSKAAGGNQAAGRRVRKKMQEIKSAAQEVRKKIPARRRTRIRPASIATAILPTFPGSFGPPEAGSPSVRDFAGIVTNYAATTAL
jgi:ribosomal protein S17E